jgi:hypothetical protein
MKIRKNYAELLVYWGLCVLSLGIIWAIRIIISQAIRCAFMEEGENFHQSFKLTK